MQVKKSIFYLFLAIFFISQGRFLYAQNTEETPVVFLVKDGEIQESVSLKVGDASYELSEDEIKKWVKSKEELHYNPDHRSEIEYTDFCRYFRSIACSLAFPFSKENHIQKVSLATLDSRLIGKFLDDFARQTNKDPVNAKLQIENGKVSVFSLSSNGIELNKEKSLQNIVSYLKSDSHTGSINLVYKEISPEISIDSLENLGINSLIGEGRSNFKGSPKNRIFNIKVAINRFNGTLIKSGEEFSFVKILGEVDKDHGYLPELVIKKDKTEPEFGGGICQVSTTTFRAAIYSGLKITARTNHAYPVRYYNPQGLDATVYVPRPDLRFINNTPGYILIQTKIEGTELIFQFYGTNDGRKVNIIGPKITQRNPDGSMKATFTQEVRDKEENLIISDIFNSNYDSPDKYPHPGEVLTEKSASWSSNEWKQYKKEHNL